MGTFLQVLAVSIVAVAAILFLKKYNGDFALLLALACICGLCVFALAMAQPVLDMLERLKTLSGINTAVIAPVFKTAAIGILTNIAVSVCADSGESGIGKMVELCGTMMALYLSMPLISAVLDLLDSLLGG